MATLNWESRWTPQLDSGTSMGRLTANRAYMASGAQTFLGVDASFDPQLMIQIGTVFPQWVSKL